MNLPSGITTEAAGADCTLLKGQKSEAFKSASWQALALPKLKRFTALSLHTHFVTHPIFGNDLSKIPDRTQFLLWEDEAGFGVLLPLLHEDFRAELAGTEEGLQIKCSCAPAGRARSEVVLALVCLRLDPYQAIEDGLRQAVQWMGRGKLRTEKNIPDWIEYLGWCTWDAFYADVNEEKILEGLTRFREGGIVPGQMIIDEGWQDYNSKNFLLSYGTKKGAFTGDSMAQVVRRAKEDFGVKRVGCWRTLFGELRGVDVESSGFGTLKRQAVLEPGTPGDVFGVVELEDVPRFHDEYAERIAAQGIDFMKVDFQSALHQMTYEQVGRAEGARIWQNSVQDSVEKHFHGQMLNCMAMGSDEVYHTRTGNVCRASDDFFPGKDDSHASHIRQNLYNSLWLSQTQWPDWDMFQSGHPWAVYHATARAISGGPVYVSDKPGTSDCNLLKRLIAADGKILRCPQPALPTRDVLFTDSMAESRLIKAFNRCGNIGLLGLFHPSTNLQSPALSENVGGWLVEGMEDIPCAVYSGTRGFLGVFDCKASLGVRLAPREAELLIFSPIRNGFASLGLVEKFNPAAAVLDLSIDSQSWKARLRGGGTFAFYSEQPIEKVLLDGCSVPVVDQDRVFTLDTEVRERCLLEIGIAH